MSAVMVMSTIWRLRLRAAGAARQPRVASTSTLARSTRSWTPLTGPCTCTCAHVIRKPSSIQQSHAISFMPKRFMARDSKEHIVIRQRYSDAPKKKITPTLDNVEESKATVAKKSQPGGLNALLAERNRGRRDQLIPGLVIANYGDRVLVQDQRPPSGPNAEPLTSVCIPRGRLMRPLCGDSVLWVPAAHMQRMGDGIVEEICPRHNELRRLDKKGHFRVRSLASNIDNVVIVMAPQPKLKPDLIDRYLGTAVTMGADVTFVYNKRDLDPIMPMAVAEFGRLGFPLLHTSTTTGEGLPDFRQRMRAITKRAGAELERDFTTTILVGQSGTGKSSLLNALIPDFHIVTRGLSRSQTAGKHTTTTSHMHIMEPGIHIIDSPGFQNYAPVPVPPSEVIAGYIEMLEYTKHCRFGSRCTHLHEPSCGVIDAVRAGVISQRRYDSYVEHYHESKQHEIQIYET